MRRAIKDSLTIIAGLLSCTVLSAQDQTVEQLNEYGTLDRWSVRKVKESGIIGGKTKYLYEFFGAQDTTETREPFAAPDGYLWRTNNVLAVVSGVTKTSKDYITKKGHPYKNYYKDNGTWLNPMTVITTSLAKQAEVNEYNQKADSYNIKATSYNKTLAAKKAKLKAEERKHLYHYVKGFIK